MKKIILSVLVLITFNIYAQDAQVEQWKDVVLTAQRSTQDDASAFISETGDGVSICDLKNKEELIDFIVYCNNNGVFSFNNPANSLNIAKNYKCNGESWVPSNSMKGTQFRVLVPGTKVVNAIYDNFKAGKINKLEDSVFGNLKAVANVVKYDSNKEEQNGSTFNTTDASLIWVRMPQADGSMKNGLIHVKEVKLEKAIGLSFVKFDMIVQN